MRRMNDVLRVLALALLLSSSACMVAGCPGPSVEPGDQVSADEISAGGEAAGKPASQSFTEKEYEPLPPPDLSDEVAGEHAQAHGEDHKPCASNYIIPPEEGDVVEQGVAGNPATAGTETVSVARLVFITTSRACACTIKRCKRSEEALADAARSYPDAPRVRTIDFAAEADRARKLAMDYKAVMLPIILFLDDKGELLLKMEGEFTAEDVNKSFSRFFPQKE